MARRRPPQGEAPPPVDEATTTATTPRTVAGFGKMWLSRDSTYAIDPLSWAENPWAMAAVIAQGLKTMVRRPIQSAVTLAVFGVFASFLFSFMRSAILVAAGRAAPVTSKDVTDPTSGTQVASWLGSQVGAPLVSGSAATLVQVSEDSLAGSQEAVTAQSEELSASPWTTQAATQVSTRGGSGGKLRLIPSQGRR